MYYTIYKTTNLINNKYYIGKHQTTDPNDKYLGSGKLILAAIQKYGRENFIKTILELCHSEEHMNQREREILTPEHVKNKNCYNCREGGEGGWGHWLNSDAAYQSRLKGGKNSGVRERNLSLPKEEYVKRYNLGLKKWIQENGHPHPYPWTKEQREIKSQRVTGNKNPMYGKCWICNAKGKTKLIDKTELHSYKSIGWVKGKKVKDTKKSSYDRCWIKKDEIAKYIKNDELSSWIEQGWTKGRITKHKNGYFPLKTK